jgi:hypothetical protein
VEESLPRREFIKIGNDDLLFERFEAGKIRFESGRA